MVPGVNRRRLIAGLTLAAVLALIGWLIRPRASGLSRAEQAEILSLSRRQLTVSASGGEAMLEIDESTLPDALLVHASSFVTLLGADEDLRGCMIDQFEAHEPLYRNVLRNTILAATGDARFAPVSPGEVEDLRIEISILSEPTGLVFSDPADLLAKLSPGLDGVILRINDRMATYLPSVWEIFPAEDEFLSRLCEKAGLSQDRWRFEPWVEIETYRVETFADPHPND